MEDYLELWVRNESVRLADIFWNMRKMLEAEILDFGAIAVMHIALLMATGFPVVLSFFSHKRPALAA